MYRLSAMELAVQAWNKHAEANADDPRVKDPIYLEGWIEGYAELTTRLGLELDEDPFDELEGP